VFVSSNQLNKSLNSRGVCPRLDFTLFLHHTSKTAGPINTGADLSINKSNQILGDDLNCLSFADTVFALQTNVGALIWFDLI